MIVVPADLEAVGVGRRIVAIRAALVFDEGQGLKLTGIPLNARRTYSIHVYFRLEDLFGYRRILSFGPNVEERALYLYDGYLNLWPLKQSADQVMLGQEWLHLQVTRSGKTGVMNFFVNGARKMTYRDTKNKYLLAKGQVVFFQDNDHEHSSGHVSRIEVWNRLAKPSLAGR